MFVASSLIVSPSCIKLGLDLCIINKRLAIIDQCDILACSRMLYQHASARPSPMTVGDGSSAEKARGGGGGSQRSRGSRGTPSLNSERLNSAKMTCKRESSQFDECN